MDQKFNSVTLKDGTEVSLYALKQVMTVEHMAYLTEEWMNTISGRSADKFAQHICSMHRTLQQSFIGFYWHVLLAIPKYTWGTDLRNEASVGLCKTLVEKVKNNELPEYMPYV